MDSLLQFNTFTTDSNNNNNFDNNTVVAVGPSMKQQEDKYSLRPRSLRSIIHQHQEEPAASAPHQQQPQPKATKSHKPKQKPAPLSKYRRKTANARERNRMREINQAFETLRQVIPQMAASTTASPTNEKLTKITTLRLAMKYIASLSAALNSAEPSGSNFMDPTFSDCSDLDCLLLESDGESLSLSDHSSSLLASPDFPESSLSPVDFGDPSSLPSFLNNDFCEPALEHPIFSDFLLT